MRKRSSPQLATDKRSWQPAGGSAVAITRRCRLEPLEERMLLIAGSDIHGRVVDNAGPTSGWVVFLDQNHNHRFDVGEDYSITDAAGQYDFPGLPLATYQVTVAAPAGLAGSFVPPLGGSSSVALVGAPITQDFQFQRSSALPFTAGRVFADANHNGIQDPGEAGVAGATVYSDGNNSGVFDASFDPNTLTDLNGDYSLSVRSANLRVVPPDGYSAVAPIGNGLTLAPIPDSQYIRQPGPSATGDFNLDGFADLAVIDGGSTSFHLLLSDGSGALPFLSIGSADAVVTALMVADFDNDGKSDIALVSPSGGKITILLNTTPAPVATPPGATPTFHIITVSLLGKSPTAIAAGDFNGDGYPDLAVANQSTSDVTVLLNHSGTGFDQVGTIAVGRMPSAITTFQMNDDNNDGVIDSHDLLDLAVTSYLDNSVTVLQSGGGGLFSSTGVALAAGAQPTSIVSGDFDLDGRPDLAVADFTSAGITALFGNGGPSFAAPQYYPIDGSFNPSSLVAADLDGDGTPDLAVATTSKIGFPVIGVFHGRRDHILVPVQFNQIGQLPLAAPLSAGDGLPQAQPSGVIGTSPSMYLAAADFDHDPQHTIDFTVTGGRSTTIIQFFSTLSPGSYRVVSDPDPIEHLDFGVAPNSATVVDRKLFYPGALHYDSVGFLQPRLPFSDDRAIATDKTAYIANNGAATFANISGYFLGITGIMVDIAGTHGRLGLNDFEFRVGNNNAPQTWFPAFPATLHTIRAGAGTSGSDRLEFIWGSGEIENEWLEVVVRGNDTRGGFWTNTGLTASDVFFFGNAPGDTGAGDSATLASVTGVDITQVQAHQTTASQNIPITNAFDINKDGVVSDLDIASVRQFQTTNSSALVKLVLSLAASAALPDGASDDEIVFALSAVNPATSIAAADPPRPVVPMTDRGGQIAATDGYFRQSVGQRPLASADVAECAPDAWALDDELFDQLLADLNR